MYLLDLPSDELDDTRVLVVLLLLLKLGMDEYELLL